MNIKEFNKLSLIEKAFYTLKKGESILARKYFDYIIKLYAMEGYFAEIWYLPSINKIQKVHTTENADELIDLYAEHIDISNVLPK